MSPREMSGGALSTSRAGRCGQPGRTFPAISCHASVGVPEVDCETQLPSNMVAGREVGADGASMFRCGSSTWRNGAPGCRSGTISHPYTELLTS